MVWFNSLVASAGGQIVDRQGNTKLGPPAVKAAQIMHDVATKAGTSSISNEKEDTGKDAFKARRPRVHGQLPVRLRGRGEGPPRPSPNIGWARYPAVTPEPAQPRDVRRHQPRRVGVLEAPGPRLRGRDVHRRSRRTRSSPPRRAAWPRRRRALQQPADQEGVPVRAAHAGDAEATASRARSPRPTATSRWRSRTRSIRPRRHRPAPGDPDLKRQPQEGQEGEALLMAAETATAGPAAPAPLGRALTDRARPSAAPPGSCARPP